MSPLEAQRQYIDVCRALPEYGARFFYGKVSNLSTPSYCSPAFLHKHQLAPILCWSAQMHRRISSKGNGGGSASRTPPAWMKPTERHEAASSITVLLGINPKGIHVRPAPPTYGMTGIAESLSRGKAHATVCHVLCSATMLTGGCPLCCVAQTQSGDGRHLTSTHPPTSTRLATLRCGASRRTALSLPTVHVKTRCATCKSTVLRYITHTAQQRLACLS